MAKAPKTPFSSVPSNLLLKFADEIAFHSKGPFVDVACGFGRNAIFLSSIGIDVTCIDNNSDALSFINSIMSKHAVPNHPAGILSTLKIDLIKDPWPFPMESLGGIIMVHYFSPDLFKYVLNSLRIGGYLFMESIDARGSNYLELPNHGFVLDKMVGAFEFIYLKEKKVGPPGSNASTIKLMAKKLKSYSQRQCVIEL